jgi:predicted RNase H-like HicB family nuclease
MSARASRRRRPRGARPAAFTVVVHQGRESGFVASCPALRGCVSQGRTRREALRDLGEAIEAYIEALLEDGLPVPTEAGRETLEVKVEVR